MNRRHTATLPVMLGWFCGSVLGQSLTTSTLPILEIDIPHDSIPDEPKVVSEMRLVYNGTGETNTVGGPTLEYVGSVGIELRGSTSQTLFPKTGYGLELRTAANTDTSASLLSMPSEEDWVLHGPYSDKTLVRNAFAYSLAGELMDYAPRTRFVELLLGGEYRGIYLLTERIKRDGDRVDIARLEPDVTDGVDLTGGYIVKLDKTTGEADPGRAGFNLPAVNLPDARPTKLLYHYPRPRDINLEQSVYILRVMGEFERRLASPSFDDPERGYAPLVDLNSFVDFALVNEVTHNGDAYRISTYLSKDRDDSHTGGRLRMGPVWDFNIALDNRDFCPGAGPRGWIWNFNEECPEDFFYAPFWWPRLFESRIFLSAFGERYSALRQNGALTDVALSGRLDSLADLLPADALARNFERWPVIGEYVWPNSSVASSYAAELANLRDWLPARMAWLDEATELVTDVDASIAEGEILFVPNPGGASSVVRGLDAEDFPIEVAWVDAVGRVVSQTRVSAGEDIRMPARPGYFVARMHTSTGKKLQGRFVGVASPD